MTATAGVSLAKALRAFAAMACAIAFACLWSAPAQAANCYGAAAQGSTGPGNWETYCWLDLGGYSHGDASDGNGQQFRYDLPDGTTMTFRLRVTSGPTLTAAAAPSWTGAAVGNTAFLGIGGRPILYQTTDGGTSNIVISDIALTPPPGSGAITAYMFVAADAESSNDGESLRFQTNGGAWTLLDRAGPTSGATYPTISGVGSSTVDIGGVGGTVGAHILGSVTPTQVNLRMVGSGLQGMMFAVRFASIRLNMQVAGARVAAADQFRFDVRATVGGSVLATGASSGSGFGPFTAATLTTASALPITLTQEMAGGSANTIDHYRSTLTCANTASSSTPLPNDVVTTSYSFGALQFGDNVQCTFTSTPYPHIQLRKTLGSNRRFTGDQFVMNILAGSTVVATTTTSGSNSTVNNGLTPQYQGTAGTTYTFVEQGAGDTGLDQYNATMSCTNSYGGSGTVLPTSPGGSITPQLGDVVLCTITNTRRGNNATLSVTKSSQVLSDPVSNSVSPFTIPGAILRYSFRVSNSGNREADDGSIEIIDELPPNIEVGTAANPVLVQGSPSSGLTFNATSNTRYSNSPTRPSSYGACTYMPTGPYDPAVRYICFNPQGEMVRRSNGNAPPSFTLSFNARVK